MSEGIGPAGYDSLGVFVNRYEHGLDTKKRLTVPSEWRELVGVPHRVFVMPGITDPCLAVYPAREMAQRMQSIRKLSISDRKGRQLARTLGSRSDLVPWDSAGRIRIKDELLDFAGLSKQVVMVGTFDGFELWNPERWAAVNDDPDAPGLGEAAEYVGF